MSDINTGKILKLIETDDINKVNFKKGQCIIVNNAQMYYDPTTGNSLADRICLNPKQEIDIFERIGNHSDQYYLDLCTNPVIDDLVIIKDSIKNTNKYNYTIYIYNDNPEDTNSNRWCLLTSDIPSSKVLLDVDLSTETDEHIRAVAGKSILDIISSLIKSNLDNSKFKVFTSIEEINNVELYATNNPVVSYTIPYSQDTKILGIAGLIISEKIPSKQPGATFNQWAIVHQSSFDGLLNDCYSYKQWILDEDNNWISFGWTNTNLKINVTDIVGKITSNMINDHDVKSTLLSKTLTGLLLNNSVIKPIGYPTNSGISVQLKYGDNAQCVGTTDTNNSDTGFLEIVLVPDYYCYEDNTDDIIDYNYEIEHYKSCITFTVGDLLVDPIIYVQYTVPDQFARQINVYFVGDDVDEDHVFFPKVRKTYNIKFEYCGVDNDSGFGKIIGFVKCLNYSDNYNLENRIKELENQLDITIIN